MTSSIRVPDAIVDVAGEDGAVIRVRRHGNPNGKRLIVSHGNGFAVDGYVAFWRRFLADFEVVAFDARNHGWNALTHPPGHDYAHMARDLDRVREAAEDEFGRKPTAGLFHSMSAQAAMVAALELGWRFDALVLFDPPNNPPEGHPARPAMVKYLDRLVAWSARRRERFADPGELAAEYAAARAGRNWAEGSHRTMAEAVLRKADDGGWRLCCPPALESSMYAQGITLDLWPKASAFPRPVKLIAGDPQRERPDATALSNEALAREGGYDYLAVPGTGHLLQLEAPRACVDAFDEYVRCFNWKTIKGSCADYRACVTCDLEMDTADFEAGHKITVPLLVIWGQRSHTEGVHGDVLSTWQRNYATDAWGGALPCGHYVPEEAPDETYAKFIEHFK